MAFVGTLPFLVLGVGIDDMFIIIDGKFHFCQLSSEVYPQLLTDRFR